MSMTARFEAACPACGQMIAAGSVIERRSDLEVNNIAAWVHTACRTTALAETFVQRFRQLAPLPRAGARAAAMHLGCTVTRNKKYVDHAEVCYRAASSPADASKWAAAVALATGAKVEAAGSGAAAAASSALDRAEIARIAREAAVAAAKDAVAEVAQPREFTVKVNDRPAVTVEGRAHKQFGMLLKMVSAGVSVWLAGPAGSGKTTAVEQAAKALGLPFYFNGAIDTEYKLSGFVDAQGRVVSTAFRRAYTEGGVYLFDEVDASLPGALLAFNAALANGACDFPGADKAVPRHPDFRCVAAGNTWGFGATAEYVGRNKLDAAFLDRFVQLTWDYDEDLERALAGNAGWCKVVQGLRAKARSRGLKVVISPRATIYGSQLLSAGLSEAEALEACVFAKLSATDRANLRAA